MPLAFDHSYLRLGEQFYERVTPSPVQNPTWLAVNPELGASLGLSEDELGSRELLEALAGNQVLPGSVPAALCYAGHQFGTYVPRLGDGRAILLGEVMDTEGVRRDLQLKGSGPTPFSRRGDGRGALGPVLREFLVSEAMYHLGVPTTRALAAVATGELVHREAVLPGAVLTRVASSHLRVGTFEYFGRSGDTENLQKLTAYALARHYPERAGEEPSAVALLEAVSFAQAQLVAKWMNLGFVHGVMNTDNCSIAGETLDFGPCAFLDGYEPSRAFSSIDVNGRYAYARQPQMALWALARLAEALLPLFGGAMPETLKTLEAILARFPEEFEQAYGAGLCKKLGVAQSTEGVALAERLLDAMARARVDYTLAFRRLTYLARGDEDHFTELFGESVIFAWLLEWQALRPREPESRAAALRDMHSANPAFIARNHRVEEAIAAAHAGELQPFARLRRVLGQPYLDQPAECDLMAPPGREQWEYVTSCGT